jgi:hypothetical protein
MSFPFGNTFGNLVVSEYAPEGTILMMVLRSKGIPIRVGETITLEKVIDWEATGKASTIITNIGTNGGTV